MYLIPIHVPIFVSGKETYIEDRLATSLEHLRDSLHGEFGPITLLAPRTTEQYPHARSARDLDGIRLVPSFPVHERIREFWTKSLSIWRADVKNSISESVFVQATTGPAFTPFPFLAFMEASRRNLPTLYVLDKARARSLAELKSRSASRVRGPSLEGVLQHRLDSYGVQRATGAMLKIGNGFDNYGHLNPSILPFFNTSYTANQVISSDDLKARLSSRHGRIRIVYFGRLMAAKRLDLALSFMDSLGAEATLTIIGNGPERVALARQARCQENVEFEDALPYGPILFKRLRQFDLQIFPCDNEDTPRSVFDGFASGLPLLAQNTAYITGLKQNGAPIEIMHERLSAQHLQQLIAEQSDRARLFALKNTAGAWYKRRGDFIRGLATTNPESSRW